MAAAKPKKKKWNYKVILIIEVVVLIVLGILYGIYYMNSKMNELNYKEIDDNDIETNENLNIDMDKYTNIVLFGGDSRSGSVDKGTHSDCIIIANINNKTKEVRLVSVYRDTFLQIAKTDPNNQKVTHAHYIGGPTMAINTLNRNLDLDIHDYITVNFEAVIKTVDLLGGIEVELKSSELKSLNKSIKEENKLYDTNVDLIQSAGTYTLNGTQALAYARIRSTDQGDITRTERQRKVIGLIVAKTKAAGLTKLNQLFDEVFPEISTSINKSELLALATNIFSYELGETSGFPFTFECPTLGKKGSVLVPADLEHNVMALHKYLFGTDNYQVSSTVKTISDSIINETGTTYKTIDLLEENNSTADTSSETTTSDVTQ